MLLKAFICLCMGAAFGWFTATEWQKWHAQGVCEWKDIETKMVVTTEIPVLDWRGRAEKRNDYKN